MGELISRRNEHIKAERIVIISSQLLKEETRVKPRESLARPPLPPAPPNEGVPRDAKSANTPFESAAAVHVALALPPSLAPYSIHPRSHWPF